MSDSVTKWHEMQESKSRSMYPGDIKIYESPDGGETVYERPFGGEPSERVMIKQSDKISDSTKTLAYRLLTEYDEKVIRYANKILDLGGE